MLGCFGCALLDAGEVLRVVGQLDLDALDVLVFYFYRDDVGGIGGETAWAVPAEIGWLGSIELGV